MIKVGKHSIGPGQKPFVIAEVGSNWRTFDEAKDSISAAKACGADAVKFQAYTHEALYGSSEVPLRDPDVISGYRWSDKSMRAHEMPLEWLPKLKAKADACGIEFMCSAFSPELVDAVDPYVNCHKVASAEMTHVRILEAVKRTGKPVILSTGASGEADIAAALEVLRGVPVILMYCVAAYPAQSIDLDVISLMRERFGMPVGYSDHSTDVLEIPRRAVKLGACVIEKHVTFIDADTPDRPHSLAGDQFMRMVMGLKGEHRAAIGAKMEETPMVLRHNRRLIATCDIPVGTAFKEGENFGIYRSLRDEHRAFSPFLINEVNGKPALRAIAAGDGIGPGDI